MPKRKRSSVWLFFTRNADKSFAQCTKCGKEYKTSGNTTNLLDHLKRSHPEYQSVTSKTSGASNYAVDEVSPFLSITIPAKRNSSSSPEPSIQVLSSRKKEEQPASPPISIDRMSMDRNSLDVHDQIENGRKWKRNASEEDYDVIIDSSEDVHRERHEIQETNNQLPEEDLQRYKLSKKQAKVTDPILHSAESGRRRMRNTSRGDCREILDYLYDVHREHQESRQAANQLSEDELLGFMWSKKLAKITDPILKIQCEQRVNAVLSDYIIKNYSKTPNKK